MPTRLTLCAKAKSVCCGISYQARLTIRSDAITRSTSLRVSGRQEVQLSTGILGAVGQISAVDILIIELAEADESRPS